MRNSGQSARVAVAVIGLALVALIVYGFGSDSGAGGEDASPFEMLLLSALCLGVIGYGVFRLIRYERALHSQRKAQAEDHAIPLARDEKDLILYLRPFKVDNRRMTPVTHRGRVFSSFESLLCSVLADRGLPIAIGKPLEKLKPLGARRIYVPDQSWKATVNGLLTNAKYVILYVDFTPGVRWEIQQSLQACRDKLILVPRLFNLKSGLWRYVFSVSPFVILYPVYALLGTQFIFRRLRRGSSYYRQWQRELGSIVGKKHVNDQVSAIVLERESYQSFKAKDATLEAQLQAIADAVQYQTQGEE